MTDANAGIIEAWNTVLFDKFLRFKHLVTQGLSGHSDEVFRRRPFAEGARVLDVGCGFGDTTLAIAAMVGPSGQAVGVDCAQTFIDVARKDASKTRLENASFVVANAQGEHLGERYDHAFSRFGTMFFASPVAALRNIRRSLAPQGKLTMIVWRRREDNPWLHEAELRVREIVRVVSPEESNQAHCGPGPFSMAGADLVSDLLGAAGFRHVTLERHDREICIGNDLAEAVDFAMTLGPAGEIMRLAGAEGASKHDRVVAALNETLGSFQRHDGIWAPSSVWFVTADN